MAGQQNHDLVVQRPEGLYCPPGDFFIDPWRPVARAVITHAHSDHARIGHGRRASVYPDYTFAVWNRGPQSGIAVRFSQDAAHPLRQAAA